jgi:hypothetical protein
MEKITLMQKRLIEAQNRQKGYADHRSRDMEFVVGDKLFLKVAPMKGVTHFGKQVKLNPHYIVPYEILERVGSLAYLVALPPHLSGIHNVFHMSALRKYVINSSHVLEVESITFLEILSYKEVPVRIVDRKENELHIYKSQWSK